LLENALEIGLSQAEAEALAWNLEAGRLPLDVSAAEAAWMMGLETQINTAQGILALGGDPALVMGDATRAGVLRAAPVIRAQSGPSRRYRQ
jgi:hypothetical protein